MWDRERLDSVDFFHNFDRSLARNSEDKEVAVAAARKLPGTWQRRARIHVAGGRGWWDETDESKIVWATGKASPMDGEEERRNCEYCIGEVRCAPHRLVLVKPLESDDDKVIRRSMNAMMISPSCKNADGLS